MIWDFAAGVLAIEEAGGVACTPDGSSLQWDSIPMSVICVANNELVQELIPIMSAWTR